MCRFFYDYLKPKYGDKCKMLFTDTDSLCCHIETEDLYADMAENIELFDTSNFGTTHPLYSLQNHRVLGKFKNESGSLAQTEFVGLWAKMYSLHIPNEQTKIRAKGMKNPISKNMSVINNFWTSWKINKLQKVSFERFGQKITLYKLSKLTKHV